jgi:predicted acyl esterase
LATDVYLPPVLPAPAIAVRTPYGRAAMEKLVGAFVSFARRGYVVISQDCRGTGDSEPEDWDYYVYEREDSFDLVEWVCQQKWFDGFLGACGGSYLAQTQWCMAMHPRMSTIVPEVGGLGIASRTIRKHMFYNAYARSVGKGADKLPVPYHELERQILGETLASGYFNEPLNKPFSEALLERFPSLHTLPKSEAQRWLWERFCTLPPAGRAKFIKHALSEPHVTIMSIEAMAAVFGQHIAHDAYMFPSISVSDRCRALHAPALMITGWYDWSLNDPFATWELLKREAREPVRSGTRLIVTPSAHNMPGYHEGMADHPELQRTHSTANQIGLLVRWYAAVRNGTTNAWPPVTYYLMGANEWRVATDWPPPETHTVALYLHPGGTLAQQAPRQPSEPDRYSYDPNDPTPTLGGSIVSYVYPPGSVDVSAAQRRADVLTYTTAPLQRDLDVVGPLVLILYASSSAIDTDFSARLTDVFPDGRAIQLQSGMLRMRYRNLPGEPELLEPGRIYRLEVSLWATANRFKAGHRLRLDISSADFPRFDRNSNRGGVVGPAISARQSIYHDPEHASHLLLPILDRHTVPLDE